MFRKKTILLLLGAILLIILTACGEETTSDRLVKVAEDVISAKRTNTETTIKMGSVFSDSDKDKFDILPNYEGVLYTFQLKNDARALKSELNTIWEHYDEYTATRNVQTHQTFYDYKKQKSYYPINQLYNMMELIYGYKPSRKVYGKYYESSEVPPEQERIDLVQSTHKALLKIIPYISQDNITESLSEKRQKYTIFIEKEDIPVFVEELFNNSLFLSIYFFHSTDGSDIETMKSIMSENLTDDSVITMELMVEDGVLKKQNVYIFVEHENRGDRNTIINIEMDMIANSIHKPVEFSADIDENDVVSDEFINRVYEEAKKYRDAKKKRLKSTIRLVTALNRVPTFIKTIHSVKVYNWVSKNRINFLDIQFFEKNNLCWNGSSSPCPDGGEGTMPLPAYVCEEDHRCWDRIPPDIGQKYF